MHPDVLNIPKNTEIKFLRPDSKHKFARAVYMDSVFEHDVTNKIEDYFHDKLSAAIIECVSPQWSEPKPAPYGLKVEEVRLKIFAFMDNLAKKGKSINDINDINAFFVKEFRDFTGQELQLDSGVCKTTKCKTTVAAALAAILSMGTPSDIGTNSAVITPLVPDETHIKHYKPPQQNYFGTKVLSRYAEASVNGISRS